MSNFLTAEMRRTGHFTIRYTRVLSGCGGLFDDIPLIISKYLFRVIVVYDLFKVIIWKSDWSTFEHTWSSISF